MKAGHIKGAILEYLVRQLFLNCGFNLVKPDGFYIYPKGNLLYVNGKGAAHDADVLMEPPIQMPFIYPSRILFECKNYSKTLGLPIVRNALGLRNDINDFEIVTKKSLLLRKNNRRAQYAIENRKRFIYQVGVAAINNFSKPAIEFAANNKIPILSLSWVLGISIINKINSINSATLSQFSEPELKGFYTFLKDPKGDIYSTKYSDVKILLERENIFGDITTYANAIIKSVYIGILETGDMIFIYPRDRENYNSVINEGGFNLDGEIHYTTEQPNIWELSIYSNSNREIRAELEFFLPEKISNHWRKYNLDKKEAINIKREYFPKIILFNKFNTKLPFTIITLNQEWLDGL